MRGVLVVLAAAAPAGLPRRRSPAAGLPHPADATWTYQWMDSVYQTTPTNENVTVKSTSGSSFTLAWDTKDAGTPDAPRTSKTFSLGSFSGGGGTYTATVNWGDGTTSTLATQPGPMSGTHTYVNDRATPYTVTVTVSDSSGNTATGTFTVAVANLPPTVKINTPGPGSNLAQRTSYAFNATFSDPGAADTHTCTIAWGDGSTSTGTVAESGGAGTCTSSHSWSSTGSYTITVTVKDNAGATATATSAITVTKNGGTVFTS